MAVDLFETRTMMEILETIKPVRTFFLDTFFKVSRTFNTESVDIDIVKGKRRLAPFVNPQREGKLVEKRGYKTRSYNPPYIKPKMVTTAEDLLKRQPGEIIYRPNSGPSQEAAAELGRNFAQMDEMITRREEWMAAQALTTGQMSVVGDGVDDVITFHMEATHLPVLTGTALWSDVDDSTPIDDLKGWRRLVAQDSGKSPDTCIMGLSAYDNFMKSEQVIGTDNGGKNLFDMRRINIGQIDPRLLPNGVTFVGTLTELGIDVFTYEEWFVNDDDDIEYPLMPTDKVLLGSTSARAERLYGAIKDLSALAPTARFPKSWTVEDPSARFAMIQSAAMPTPIEIDAFLTATVL